MWFTDLTSLAKAVVFIFSAGPHSIALGTAFIVGCPVYGKPEQRIPVIVTAKHVIGNREQLLVRFSPKEGNRALTALYNVSDLRRNNDIWEHSDKGVDLIAFRTAHFPNVDYATVDKSLIASKKIFYDQHVSVTDKVMFPALVPAFIAAGRNTPIFRSGFIALLPENQFSIEYSVGTEQISTQQEVLLIDAIAAQGSSGAPVFVNRPQRF